MSVIKYVRLYADVQGESHMEQLEVELRLTDFVPPALPIDASSIEPAASYGFLLVPAGYRGDWHPSPKRQWSFFLAGAMEFEVSDGAVHRADPGSAILLEDITGRGHRSQVVSDVAAVVVAVQLSSCCVVDARRIPLGTRCGARFQ